MTNRGRMNMDMRMCRMGMCFCAAMSPRRV